MRTLTADAIKILNSRNPAYFKRIFLAVRKWSGTAYTYDTEIDITDDVVEISALKWKLDSDGYNEWTFSNVSLELKNNKNQYKAGNTLGYFGTDKVIFKSKIRIKAGVLLPDDSEDLTYLFTGFIKTEPTYNTDDKTVTISLSSHLSLFQDANAENISTTVTDELLGSDSGTEFTTANNGVGIISELKKGTTAGGAAAATILNPSTDYTTSDLSKKDIPAKITLKNALIAGQSLWVTYKYWYQDKTLEWIVAELCTEAGITSTSISPAIFENDAQSIYTQSTAAQFDAGTDSDTDHTSGDVYISKTFMSSENEISPSWTVDETPTNGTWVYPHTTPSGIAITGTLTLNGWASAHTAQPNATGTWAVRCNASNASFFDFHFISSTGNRTNSNGYMIRATTSGGTAPTITLGLYTVTNGTASLLQSKYFYIPTSGYFYEYRVSRNSDYEFHIVAAGYTGGGERLNFDLGSFGVHATHTTSQYLIVARECVNETPGGTYYGFTANEIRYDDKIMTGYGDYYPDAYYLSETIDGTASLTHWGNIATEESKPVGTSTYIYIRSKAAIGDAWGDWELMPVAGNIATTNRYVQFKWQAYADTSQVFSPLLASWTVYWYTDAITIPLVNMSGKNCLSILEDLAEMVSYEIGFDGSDIFFFRPRTSTISPVEILDKDKIISLETITDGSDRLYNTVRVTFGDYEKISDSVSEGETSPTTLEQFGVVELSISNSNLLPSENVNLAYAVAPTVYKYTNGLRRRATLSLKFLMALELGDSVKINYEESTILRLWKWGDTFVQYGNADYIWYNSAYASGLLSLYDVDMRVEGIEFDLEKWQMKLNLVEVI